MQEITNDRQEAREPLRGDNQERRPDTRKPRNRSASVQATGGNRDQQEEAPKREVTFELNRAARRRMKKGAKLAKTPTREEASALLVALKSDFAKKYDLKNEPVKVRIPRAFEGADEAGV